MKKIFVIVATVISVLGLAGCEPLDTGNDNTIETTELTISNNSSKSIYRIVWSGTNFMDMNPGGKWTSMFADPGSGYVFFQKGAFNSSQGRTQELVTVEKGEEKTFIFLDSTVVVDDEGKTYTLLEFMSQ